MVQFHRSGRTVSVRYVRHLLRCVREGRPEVEAEVKEQMKVLAEINRIKFEGAAGAFAMDAIMILAKTARVALAAAGIAL